MFGYRIRMWARMLELLFSPIRIGHTVIKNRIYSSGHQTLLVNDGFPNEDFVAYHERRAAGGCGLIIMEATSVHETAYFNSHTVVGYLRDCIPGFTRVAEAIHRHGCKVVGQLFHPGAEVPAYAGDGTRPRAYSASTLKHERYLGHSVALSRDLIESIIEGYATTASHMLAAGIDGVEVMASHGYLPAQFLNPHQNVRDDEYGGSLENRVRFLLDVARRVRLAVGKDIFVGLRISADENDSRGLPPDDVKAAIELADREGLFDYYNITTGTSFSAGGSTHIVPSMQHAPAFVAPVAADIKFITSRPILVTGRINQPQEAEKIISAGQADMCGMTRAMICDPDMPNKANQGRLDDIRACVACNQACIGHYQIGAPISCIQTPQTGRERTLGVANDRTRPKRIVVVGGGPAGMRAAATAAQRGHSVTLLECADRLGGQVNLAQLLPGRAEFGGVTTNLKRELDLAGVDVRLNVVDSFEELTKLKPDHVYLATGSRPYLPKFENGNPEAVFDAWAIVDGQRPLGPNVVIVDWNGDWVGSGVAEHLAQSGYKVQYCSSASTLCASMQSYVRDEQLGRLDELGVAMRSHMRFWGYLDRSAFFEHTASRRAVEFNDVDSIILAYGAEKVDPLSERLGHCGIAFSVIGDASSPRSVEEAILDAFQAVAGSITHPPHHDR